MTTIPASLRRSSPPLGLGAQLFLLLLTVVPIVLTLTITPIFSCARCGPCPQLVGYTRLPGVTPAQAEAMLAWGYSFPCSNCGNTGRLSLLKGLAHGICSD
jgi:hypothetical protein